jgi:hypothetical protein
MRSYLAGTSISLGAVSLSFSAVIFILTFAVHQVDPSQGLRGRIEVAMLSLVLGAVLLGIGVLLRGRRSSAPVRE